MNVRASSSRTPNSSASRTASSWATAAWRKACSNIATAARRTPKSSRLPTPSHSCAGGSQTNYRRQGMSRVLALVLMLPLAAHAAPTAEAQREPEIKAALQHAIDQAECFEDRYDSAVWYKMMEPRLRKRVPDRDERME